MRQRLLSEAMAFHAPAQEPGLLFALPGVEEPAESALVPVVAASTFFQVRELLQSGGVLRPT